MIAVAVAAVSVVEVVVEFAVDVAAVLGRGRRLAAVAVAVAVVSAAWTAVRCGSTTPVDRNWAMSPMQDGSQHPCYSTTVLLKTIRQRR